MDTVVLISNPSTPGASWEAKTGENLEAIGPDMYAAVNETLSKRGGQGPVLRLPAPACT